MTVIAFTFNAKPADLELAKRCLQVITEEHTIFNIPQFKIEDQLTNNCMVICFGPVVAGFVKQALPKYTNVQVIELPKLANLYPTDENIEARKDALTKLQTAHEQLANFTIQEPKDIKEISKKDIDNLEDIQIALLKKMSDELGKTSCIRALKDGRTLEIGNSKDTESKADIFLTFYEIHTISQVMKVLDIEKIEIVDKSK